MRRLSRGMSKIMFVERRPTGQFLRYWRLVRRTVYPTYSLGNALTGADRLYYAVSGHFKWKSGWANQYENHYLVGLLVFPTNSAPQGVKDAIIEYLRATGWHDWVNRMTWEIQVAGHPHPAQGDYDPY
jgi:hypothetical protein